MILCSEILDCKESIELVLESFGSSFMTIFSGNLVLLSTSDSLAIAMRNPACSVDFSPPTVLDKERFKCWSANQPLTTINYCNHTGEKYTEPSRFLGLR